MVFILSVFLLCLAPNLDNMAIGLAYGARKIAVPLRSNFAIALFSGVATLLSSLLGNILTNYIPVHTGAVIGGLIVSGIGLYTVMSFLYNKRKSKKNHANGITCIDNLKAVMDDPGIADRDYSGDISLKESILLGIALASNCLGTGFGAGMAGINTFVLTAAVIVFSLATISLGAMIGRRYASGYLGERATVVSGILMIIIGLYQILS